MAQTDTSQLNNIFPNIVHIFPYISDRPFVHVFQVKSSCIQNRSMVTDCQIRMTYKMPNSEQDPRCS